MKSLISFGEILVDQLQQDVEQHPTSFAGGAPANVAVCYSKLGGDSFFVGGLGDDNHAKFLYEELKKTGVDTSYIKIFQASKTATALITLDSSNERSFKISRNGTADTLFRKEHLNQSMFKQGRLFHFCSNTLTDQNLFKTTEYVIKTAFENDMIICFDVNLRFDLWSDQSLIEKRVSNFYSRCDIIKMSFEELEYLADKRSRSQPEYILQIIALGVGLVIVTDGENAIKAYTKQAKVTIQPPSIKVKDTTAAGDAFIGAFLWYVGSSLQCSRSFNPVASSIQSITAALEFAAVCGALTCTEQGAFTALPSKHEIDEFYR